MHHGHFQVVHSSFNLNISYPHHINDDQHGITKKLTHSPLEKPLI